MSNYKKYAISSMIAVVGVVAAIATTPVYAGHAGAFLGGIAVARIGRNIRDNTEAQEDQAYYAQQSAQIAAAQAAPPQKSTEARLAELNKLAAGGYITKEEYKTKKQKILDGI